MAIRKRELEILVECVIRNLELTADEAKIMVAELGKKILTGFDSYKERVALTAYILYPDNDLARDHYVNELMAKHRRNTGYERS